MPLKRCLTADPKTSSCLSCSKADNMKMVRCDDCDGWYHYTCAGVTAAVAFRDWSCSTCRSLQPSALIRSQHTQEQLSALPQPSGVPGKEIIGKSCIDTAAVSLQVGEADVAVVNSADSKLVQHTTQASSKTAATEQNAESAELPRSSQSVHLPITSAAPVCVAASVRSQGSKVSSLGARRLHAEISFVREEEEILRQKEVLLRQRRELYAQLEDEEENSSCKSVKSQSMAQIEKWIKDTEKEPTENLGISCQKNELTSTNELVQSLMEKIAALEIQVRTKSTQKPSSQWLPSIHPSVIQELNRTHTQPPVGASASKHHLTYDQLAVRKGVNRDLPKFAGHPEEWPLFIASYEQTTTLCNFSDGENLIRLRQALEGAARNAVKNLLLHDSCVPQILSTLRMKFGRPELIIDVLLSQIRDMPTPKENRLDTIVDFAIEVQNVCATMKASGLLNHLNNPELEKELVGKLPSLLAAFWGMHKTTLSSCTLENFSDWLFHFAQGANSVILPSNLKKSNRRGVLNAHRDAEHVDDCIQCVVCNGSCHSIKSCRLFNELSREGKWNTVRKHSLCRKCLNPHFPAPCNIASRCNINGCRSFHHPLLHSMKTDSHFRNNHKKGILQISSKPPIPENELKTEIVNVAPSLNLNHNANSDRILFRILPVILYGNGVQLTAFAFFDDGSSLTLIDEDLIRALNLNGESRPLCLRWTANTHRYEDESKLVNMEISAPGSAKRFPLNNVHTVKNLDLPFQTLDAKTLQAEYKHLRGLPIKSYSDAAPRLLIGLNNSKLGQPIKCREGSNSEPIAEKTRLGWTIKGPAFGSSLAPNQSHLFHACDCDTAINLELLEIVKNYICLDNLGVAAKKQALSVDDQRALEQLERLTCRVGDRFQTGLLWASSKTSLSNNICMAKRRADCLFKRMQRDQTMCQALQEKISDYLRKGYAKKLSKEETYTDDCWYLPVFPVANPNKPGKLRLVWDAAAKVDGVSLNTMLLKGPDQLTSLISVLRKFRQRRVAIGGDIEEMYHQVQIRPEDQKYQRFLWYEPGATEPTAFVMTVMTFGATCSPSCAQFVKNKNATEFSDNYPRAAQSILENHYVDDMLDSVDTEAEAIKLARDVRFIHAKGGFKIRNWVSNSTSVLRALDTETAGPVNLDADSDMAAEKVLGMWWCPTEDCFTFKVSKRYKNQEVLLGKRRPTKREVLSLVMTIFDPLGLLGFYVIYAKIIFQETWRSGCAWDEIIHEEQYVKWCRWLAYLPEVESLRIPRCYLKVDNSNICAVEVHTFVDASENGYAAASYIRWSDVNIVECTLIGSKTRVAPVKVMSIPRLELQAALLGARFAQNIISTHSLRIIKQVFWTDSRTVLAWLRSDHRRYQQFVAFRVGEILELTDISDWRWIPTEENVADEATKWKRAPDFSSSSRWLNGPAFLKLSAAEWPQENNPAEILSTLELRTNLAVHVVDTENGSSNLIKEPERFSTWRRLFRVTTALVHIALRWLNQSRKKLTDGRPSKSEMERAEQILWKDAQASAFSQEINLLSAKKTIPKSSPIYKLSPYLDKNRVLRLGSRLQLETRSDPVILPRKNHITQLIVDEYHRKYQHGNHETVVNEIRQYFWISRLRAVVNAVRRKCQVCKNESVTPMPPKMASLHPTRLAYFCRPFSYVGVDYFGPIFVNVKRSTEKRYGVLLTCLTTRAVHLEVAHSLSADSCIIAIRNFIARRGSPIEMWSDNGTNFKGAERELTEAFSDMDKDKIVNAFTSPSMQWYFIPPSSPHMGGAWERLVRSVKSVLSKVLPSQRPSDELLRGALIEVELIVNSRPLTYIPVSNDNEEALTPNHFLLGSSNGSKPLAHAVNDGVILRKCWQTSQQIANAFWKRWVVEYLPIITRRTKWFEETKPIEVNNIVVIVDPANPRNCWPRGRVVEVKKGADGRVRSAMIKTAAGLYEKPAAKIAVLDVGPLQKEVGPAEDIPGGSVTKDLATPNQRHRH